LQSDEAFAVFKSTSNLEPTVRSSLSRFLRKTLQLTVESEALHSHLTSIVPFSSRQVPGLQFADISLAASVHAQNMLFKYRRGVLMFGMTCVCLEPFQRGHEEVCRILRVPCLLSRRDQENKRRMKSSLPLIRFKFTDIDYLLNTGRLEDVIQILLDIRGQLHQQYVDNKATKDI
jgi:hypothetical protein